MARGRKTSLQSIEAKIEKQRQQLEKSREKYEADKAELARLMKLRSELRTGEVVEAMERSSRSYEEIMAFINGEDSREDNYE